jgi:hypothetical protein
VAARQQWQLDYGRARAELLAGHFARAADLFRKLSSSARDGFDRRLALEQAALATEWSKRGLRLVSLDTLSELDQPIADRRSTDEISILYTNAAAYGLGTGLALVPITDADRPASVILPTLAIAGAAVGAVAIVDAETRLGYGVPQSVVSGMYIGLEQGISWVVWNQARARRQDQWQEEVVSALIWASATAGAALGGIVGSVRGTTPGRASFVGSTALWAGSVAGLLGGSFGDDNDGQRDDRAMLSAALGVNAGVVAGVLMAGDVSPSIARVRFLDLGAVGGGVVLGGLYLAAADDGADSRSLMTTTALGIGAGFGIAWFATRKMAPDRGPSERATAIHERSFLSSLSASFAPTRGGALLALHGSM